MSGRLDLPILVELIPGGVRYGANYEVQFEPHSLWYETSLTITAHAIKNGIRTEYHTFQHIPGEVREALSRLGLNVKQSEEEKILRILDTYSVTTGLGAPQRPAVPGGRVPYEVQSFSLSDWSISLARLIKDGAPEEDKRWMHIDDNTSVLNQYNDEKLIIDIWRTRAIPYSRARELAMFHSHVTGIASNSFYKQFEQLCDGIIDMKSEERGGQMEHFVRVRSIRGQTYDSRWRRLQLAENGEVSLLD